MVTVLDSLNEALHYALAADPRVTILGEDVLDPYGGAFKVTRGLSTSFPDRVLATPVSEAGMVGLAAGMALRGLLPVVEIMFGDFITLASDQLVNHVAKFTSMYGQPLALPMVVRTPMGGRRGYGPTHSQSLEKLFMGVPGLRLLAPTSVHDPGALLSHAILEDRGPVLFIEHKLLYTLSVQGKNGSGEFDISLVNASYAPTAIAKILGAPQPHLTIAAYGYSAELARQAAWTLAYQHEVFSELVIPTQLAPFEMQPLLDSVSQTGKLLVVEEGNRTLGWGAEVVALTAEVLGRRLEAVYRLGGQDTPIPATPTLEAAVLPDVPDIVRESIRLCQSPSSYHS